MRLQLGLSSLLYIDSEAKGVPNSPNGWDGWIFLVSGIHEGDSNS